MTAASRAIVCTSTNGCRGEDGKPLRRISFLEVERLRDAGVNVFMDATRCAAYPGIWHVKGQNQ